MAGLDLAFRPGIDPETTRDQSSTEAARIRLSWHNGRPLSAAQALNAACTAARSSRFFGGAVIAPQCFSAGNHRMGQDKGVLADHAQEARARIAAHLAELFGQRLPQPDDILARPPASQAPKLPMLGGHIEHRRGVVAHRFELAPMADQPRIAQQAFQRLVRHRPHAARVEPVEHLLERRPFRVDEAVLEPGAKDPQRHLRQVAVVRRRLQLGAASSASATGLRTPPRRAACAPRREWWRTASRSSEGASAQ